MESCPRAEQRRKPTSDGSIALPGCEWGESSIYYGYPLANILVVSSTKLEAIPKRSYRSKRRERQARETRERILAVASAEFEDNGYVATTIRAVAEAAGVSVPTVELIFGTKSQLLRAAISFAIRGDAEPVAMLEAPVGAESSGRLVCRWLPGDRRSRPCRGAAAIRRPAPRRVRGSQPRRIDVGSRGSAPWSTSRDRGVAGRRADQTRLASRRDHTGAGDRHDLAADGSPRIHRPDS